MPFVPFWKCPDCQRQLSIQDWTYSDLAHRGTPVCSVIPSYCDVDMELIETEPESQS